MSEQPIEALITRLVREAPELDLAAADQLVGELTANGTALARAIARIVELVAEQLVDPGIALPALAMACATLVDERSTSRELAAAEYEIATLTPLPDRPLPPAITAPDVAVERLSRGPRPRT